MTHTKTTPAAEMQCVSIGYTRVDGDFQVLATLNNNDGLLSVDAFGHLTTFICKRLKNYFYKDGIEIIIEHRQDAPDYVTLD